METKNRWYILNVMSGQENKIASEVKSLMMKSNFSDKITDVLVPTKNIIKIKKGQKIQEAQKVFPGYVFVNADLSGEILTIITSIPKAMGFLGGKNNPQPVADSKMEEILKLSSSQEVDNKSIIFEIGEIINVIEGPFESFTGSVEEFDVEKQKVKIAVSIFGRATSVELDIAQVEKIV
jgi:transcription termination/antitermination protein NusG